MNEQVKTKKLINAPENIIAEMIEGMVGAHPDMLRVEGETGRAVVAVDGPREGKVGIVVGGGSGHEPAFAGYVGRGLADAAAVGNVFASPSPAHIAEAARAADGGAGVLMLYGNYTGDVLNFTMAAEELAQDGMDVRHVAVADDVASAPLDRKSERRGIAGDFFVFKVAGAAADLGESLPRVEALAQAANEATRSMGVALSPCSLPQTGKPNFSIGDDEMEIGMGLHGEPGIRRQKLAPADEVTDELMASVVEELALKAGDRVAVLVNGLGATTHIELYLIFRRVKQILDGRDVQIHASWVGEYATSLEMAGASVTLMKLDATLQALLDHPCHTPALTVGAVQASDREPASHRKTQRSAEHKEAATDTPRKLITEGDVTPALFKAMMMNVGNQIIAEKNWLSELDGVIGDGDHGITMEIGWKAVQHALEDEQGDETIEAICKRMAKAFLDAVGASSGPLYATAFLRAGTAVSNRLNLDGTGIAEWLAAASQGIQDRGRAAPGDKTMIDAWVPAVEAANEAAKAGKSTLDVLIAARDGAEAGMKATAAMESRRGRSAKLGERSIGHIDPGAASTFVTLRAMAEALQAKA
ncbi:dihydroxyacetone kinase subunit DhaL [Brucella pseudogrignonensis]|uniref:Dihydroxyacetone kinase subunit DhaK n=1 Tax=Brucella pseudogrignonensis TaxID=419475 RepID=A0A7Y3T0T7_9HYPH|nr:dihydroxyacetone kinase subunit DhaL [Brucella pseudogrignonensis]MQP41565.1 dihydroxyacetone kinase subunit DhaK [Ochrobactrum sp. MYb237]KAB2687230.1 dihydroxyacetone kinase subunit DhaK [Brucella pseudogrignonensis]MCM0752579.1 dihydroxyacetone kinase subunit DhaK [Brucella pseudogrignonensis]NNV18954.1 dihydroxyacetone kinase subunit DhaK [Brucella pseudogrignonensis]PQZ40122.1 dihydroxyacetone kinase [Brucella pseudogrignonensis]